PLCSTGTGGRAAGAADAGLPFRTADLFAVGTGADLPARRANAFPVLAHLSRGTADDGAVGSRAGHLPRWAAAAAVDARLAFRTADRRGIRAAHPCPRTALAAETHLTIRAADRGSSGAAGPFFRAA